MGLKPLEVKALFLKDFNVMLTGYMRRQDREWDRTRHVMWAVMNFANGVADPITPQQIKELPIDKIDQKHMITSIKMAIELLAEFMAE